MRKQTIKKTLGIMALSAALCSLSTAQAALQFTMGTPQEGNSWTIAGNTILQQDGFTIPFDEVIITTLAGSDELFESPGMSVPDSVDPLVKAPIGDVNPGWSLVTDDPTQLIAQGPETTFLYFDLNFLGDLGPNGFPLLSTAVELQAYYLGAPVDGGSQTWSWPGGDQPPGEIVVPEPSTIIAGALLLLPFGISTVRRLRR